MTLPFRASRGVVQALADVTAYSFPYGSDFWLQGRISDEHRRIVTSFLERVAELGDPGERHAATLLAERLRDG